MAKHCQAWKVLLVGVQGIVWVGCLSAVTRRVSPPGKMTAAITLHWVVLVVGVQTAEDIMANANKLVVAFSMRVSGGGLPDGYSVTIPVRMDFTGMDNKQLAEIASRALRIDVQRTMRTKPVEYLNGLVTSGLDIHASNAGQNVLTAQERAGKLAAQLGIEPALALKIIENPTLLDKLA